MWSEFNVTTDYKARLQAVTAYNNSNKWSKKGIAMTTVKFGIQWQANQVVLFLLPSLLSSRTILLNNSFNI
jgi:xanthine dehydrogenase molybdopterin-binding subunit B